jgi:hypothetical protein
MFNTMSKVTLSLKRMSVTSYAQKLGLMLKIQAVLEKDPNKTTLK